MRIVVQRVRRASVTVDGREVAAIDQGLLALVGFVAEERVTHKLSRTAQRLIRMRIFDDDEGRLNLSLQGIQGELLLIPQITLTAHLQKGTRPSFDTAAKQKEARELFEAFVGAAKAVYPKVLTGIFQAQMVVSLENDGPITFVLDDP